MKAMRFELMHPEIPEPKSGALNRSAKLPIFIEKSEENYKL